MIPEIPPTQPELIPFNIGIAPAPKPAEPIPPPSADRPPAPTWRDYVAWRKTKCPVRDASAEAQRLANLDQATHALVGEVAGLGELFIGHGPAAFYGEQRARLIDACGDIVFCACWAMDAWGPNPLADADEEIELLRVADTDPILGLTEALASRPLEQVMANQPFVSVLGGVVFQAMLHAQTHAGLTAVACEGRVHQGRHQDAEQQVNRVINTLAAVNQILILANSSVEEALTANRRKLDASDPAGRAAGGGILAGEGR